MRDKDLYDAYFKYLISNDYRYIEEYSQQLITGELNEKEHDILSPNKKIEKMGFGIGK
jgi:thiaminase